MLFIILFSEKNNCIYFGYNLRRPSFMLSNGSIKIGLTANFLKDFYNNKSKYSNDFVI